MVISGMIKRHANRGREHHLFFYRDRSQREVDVLDLQADNRINAYEIKAGKTFNTDYFKNLQYLRLCLGDRLAKTMVVYDGEQENLRDVDGHCNFRNLQ